MSSIVFMTGVDDRFGFGIAGVRHVTATTADVEDRLSSLIDEIGEGVLAVDERLLAAIDDERLAVLERRFTGVLVALPAPAADVVDDEYALRLIRRAVGYQMRLQL